ncbi:MAG: MarR family transcriptional regulator [Micromonosporaceae bacterium]|nr:MarR family transcriptional regulator [Micromonosporaceae bacterium]
MRRDELMARLMDAAPRVVAEGLNFHLEVANQLGLSLADLRYLQSISAIAPATPGQIAARTGLTSGAVTRMVDRLEQAGFVRRTRDVADRRSVVVVTDEQAAARVAAMYADMSAAWVGVLNHYTDEQLMIILDLFERLGEMSARQVEQLRRSGRGEP